MESPVMQLQQFQALLLHLTDTNRPTACACDARSLIEQRVFRIGHIVIEAPKVSIITQGAQAAYGGGAVTCHLSGA
jgi:hypothetical protein